MKHSALAARMEKIGAISSIVALALSVAWKYPDYTLIVFAGTATLTFLGLGAIKNFGSEHYLNKDEAEVEKLRAQLRAEFWNNNLSSLAVTLVLLAVLGTIAWSVYLHRPISQPEERGIGAMKSETDKALLRKPRTATTRPSSYQPSKAEKEEELDMPGASIDTIRSAFFRPIVAKEPEE